MAAPIYPNGILSKSIRWARQQVGEKSGGRFSNDQVLEFLSAGLHDVTEVVYGMTPGPPLSRHTFTIEAEQDMYMLPADMKELHRIACIEPTTGLPKWEYLPRSKYRPSGPGVIIEGNRFIRFVPTPTEAVDGETITVEYIPGGMILLHQNASPVWGSTGDTGDQLFIDESTLTEHDGYATIQLMETSTDWFMGEFDQRPEAFVGMMIRVLGTVSDTAPSGYGYFPVQERVVNWYDAATEMARVEPAWDFDAGATGDGLLEDKENLVGSEDTTYVIYEVLPVLDPALFYLAANLAAQEMAESANRRNKVKSLKDKYNEKLRLAGLRWASMQTRVPPHMDSEEFDARDDWGIF